MNVEILMVELEGEYIDMVTYFDTARQIKTADLSELRLRADDFDCQSLQELLEDFENIMKGDW